MTADQILKAFDKYEQHLTEWEAIRVDTSTSHPSPGAAKQHLRWMIGQVREQLSHGGDVGSRMISKAERWLCFIQGVAWTLGWSDFKSGPSIDDFRDDNR